VLRELDLRARRDERLRAAIDAHERGWRASLTDLLTQGMGDGTLNQALAPEAAAELIIAAVKGASLNPVAAPAALGHLYFLLAYTGAQQDRPDPEG
jgi:hypothetical protein